MENPEEKKKKHGKPLQCSYLQQELMNRDNIDQLLIYWHLL